MKGFLKGFLKLLAVLLTTALIVAAAAAAWHLHGKLPQRDGQLPLSDLTARVSVAYDERGVPHIRAGNEIDLYRALGFVHAQDRLFQMEMARRLARGELAAILGPKLLDTDRLFRTLELRERADADAARMDKRSPTYLALMAYLDGVNQYQSTRPLPLEFELMGITPRPFTPADTLAISGYLAYTFAAAFRTEPVLTYVRDQLGADHLKVFDLEWHPLGVVGPLAESSLTARLTPADWQSLARLVEVGDQAQALSGVAQFSGSNAWAISGRLTQSGKPLLAGDPHIAFSAPAVWYEAHLSAPGFELYGHHSTLIPFALLGHNQSFGWSLTMFQNDDMDLVAEKLNPDNPKQVWHQGQWVDLKIRQETIEVKGADPVRITLRRSPHGPLINEVFADSLGKTPVAMWWTFLESDNPLLDAFYELDRADTRAKARQAASKIHAPGLNVVWANAAGDIGWWAAARLPQRPERVNPNFILNGSTGEADKPGYYRFADNPQEENPARGYIVSANHQPAPASGVPVPGYYNLYDRVQRLDQQLRQDGVKWDTASSQALQLDSRTGYGPRLLKPLLADMQGAVNTPVQKAAFDQLAQWDGSYPMESIAPTVFNQFLYELTQAAMADELPEPLFTNLLRSRTLESALARLAADETSPWWDDRKTAAVEKRRDIVQKAWRATFAHLEASLGKSTTNWAWGQAHTVTHGHPLGLKKPLHLLFNVGPFPAPGGRELPNYFAFNIGPAPWPVHTGPSTRRVIDFADASKSVGINPVGQSGVLFDRHHHDQAQTFISGGYQPQHLEPADVKANTRSKLTLQPAQ
jgi:penicillin amidase